MSMMMAALALAAAEVTIAGQSGPLAGTLVDAGRDAPVVVMIPAPDPPIATATIRWG